MTARSASRACRSRSRNSSARPIGMGSPRAGGEIGHVRPVDGRDSESFVVTRRPFAIESPLFSRLDRHRHRLGAARSRSADAGWLRPRPGADQWFAARAPRHSCGRNHDHFAWGYTDSTNTSEDLTTTTTSGGTISTATSDGTTNTTVNNTNSNNSVTVSQGGTTIEVTLPSGAVPSGGHSGQPHRIAALHWVRV